MSSDICFILLLAWCLKCAESVSLSSLLLDAPTTLRNAALRTPAVETGSASKQTLSGRVLPRNTDLKVEEVHDVVKVLAELGLHRKAEPIQHVCQEMLDQRHSSYRSQVQRQIRRGVDKDVKLMRSIYEFKQEKFGKNDPRTFKSLHNYAKVLSQVGRHIEAEPLKRELLELRRRELGADHEDTQNTMRSYVETLLAMSRYDEVKSLQKELLDIARRTLGGEHPDTIKALSAYKSTLEAHGSASSREFRDLTLMCSGL